MHKSVIAILICASLARGYVEGYTKPEHARTVTVTVTISVFAIAGIATAVSIRAKRKSNARKEQPCNSPKRNQ
jgi:hypothetical protein